MAMKLDATAMRALLSALRWTYDKAVDGVPGLDSAGALAASYQAQFATSDEAIEALIRWQIAKAAAAGFITNIGGLATLPVALPANLASALYIQLRMVAAIAVLRGHDLKSDQVRTVVLACLCGTTLADVAKEAAVGVGAGIAQQAATSLSSAALERAKHVGGMELLRKAAGRVPLNLSRIAPLIGGLVAGTLDGVLTRSYASAAKRLFAPIAT